jgi:formate dehydrogenase subunit gamma
MRIAHWALAITFLLLLLTGFTNYVPELKAMEVSGGRLWGWVHVVLGFLTLGLSVVIVLSLFVSRSLRKEVRELSTVTLDDYLWLQQQGLRLTGESAPAPPVGKYNAGQKVNAVASAVGTAGLLGTGAVLGVNYFSKSVLGADFVANLFPWHTLLAIAMVPLVVGHIYLAAIRPSTREALRGMTVGVVRREWARRHHPAWRPDSDE